MGALTQDTPKPLLEVAGVPMLLRILKTLEEVGFSRVHVVVGVLGELVRAASAEWRDKGELARLDVCLHRQDEPLGTAHAALCAREGVEDSARRFLLLLGDVLLAPAAISRLLDASVHPEAAGALMVNAVDDPTAGAAVYVTEDGWVERIVEKPPAGTSSTPWNNTGAYLLPTRSFAVMSRLAPSERGELELPDAVSQLLADGCRLRAAPARDGEVDHVGTPGELLVARIRRSPGATRS